MNKRILQKKIFNNSDKIIKQMGLHLSKEDYAIMLEIIDEYIINVLKIDKEDLPWLNKEKNKNKHKEFLGMLKLVIARCISEESKLNSTITKH